VQLLKFEMICPQNLQVAVKIAFETVVVRASLLLATKTRFRFRTRTGAIISSLGPYARAVSQ
jgi:hypothetical protein